MKFMAEHLWIWFLEESIKGSFFSAVPRVRLVYAHVGEMDTTGKLLVRVGFRHNFFIKPETCDYGYACRSQGRNLHHAETKNVRANFFPFFLLPKPTHKGRRGVA
jgi:hypothetical protein